MALAASLALAVLTVVLTVGFIRSLPERRWRPHAAVDRSKFAKNRRPDLTDVGQQLLAVMAASFERCRLLNASEYRVFKIIEDDVRAERRGHRVFAQTNLGEILRSSNVDAFRSINSKRVDILVVDRGGWPILAVEFQGVGHYQGTAAARDAVKKEALRKAGVRYLEIFAGDSEDRIRFRVREQLGWRAIASAPV